MSSFLFPSWVGTRTAMKSSPVSRPRRPLPFLWDMQPHCRTTNGAYDSARTASRTFVFIFHAPFLSLDFSESSLQTSSEFLFYPSRHVNLRYPAQQGAPDIDLVGCLQLVCYEYANSPQFLVGKVSFFLLAGALHAA